MSKFRRGLDGRGGCARSKIKQVFSDENIGGKKFGKSQFLDFDGGRGGWGNHQNGFERLYSGSANFILFARIRANHALHFGGTKFRNFETFPAYLHRL